MHDTPNELTAGARALVKAVKKHAEGKVNDFGRTLGCGPGMVSKWMRGESKPSIHWRTQLEKQFGIPFMAWGDERKAKPKTRKAA